MAADIYKNDTAYTNPDYVLEHWATGKIKRFAENEGASSYRGLIPLRQVEKFARKNFHLPLIPRESAGIFGRADSVLASLEEAYLHLFDHEHRLAALEQQLRDH